MSDTIKREYRGINFEYTVEFAIDLASVHGLDANKEIEEALDRFIDNNEDTTAKLVRRVKVEDGKAKLYYTRER